jgi:hypothetical protein
MLNGAAAALKAVGPDNVVLAGGTSARAGSGLAPLTFWRRLLAGTARFDVAAHDPVTGRKPSARLGRNDLGLARLGRLRRLLGRHRPLWLTRMAWETRPLAPGGVRPATQARYLVDGLYLADRARAAVVIWDGLQDRTSFLTGFPNIRSGLYFRRSGGLRRARAKPALRAFLFPFLARASGGRTRFWGLAPGRGRVAIERRSGRRWRIVARARAGSSREFRTSIARRPGRYRAVQRGRRSLQR